MQALEVINGNGETVRGNFNALIAKLARGHLAGLKLANNGADAVNDLDIAIGHCTSDDFLQMLSLAATHVKQVDVTFAEYAAIGTASGGRDSADNLTGAKWFRVYLIGGSGKNDQAFLSTSDTPTLPPGFTVKRRIAYARWTGTTLKAFVQTGDQFLWKASVLDVDATNPGINEVLAPLTVPPLTEALINVQLMTGAGGASDLVVSDPARDNEAPSTTAAPLSTLRAAASETRSAGQIRVRTDSQSRIRYRLTFSDASTIVRIATIGYIDRAGRDD